MSIERLKANCGALPSEERRKLMAFMVVVIEDEGALIMQPSWVRGSMTVRLTTGSAWNSAQHELGSSDERNERLQVAHRY